MSNAIKVLLQRQSGFLQLESTIPGDSDWYSRPYIFFVLRKKYSKP
jgi:hypothetical protein